MSYRVHVSSSSLTEMLIIIFSPFVQITAPFPTTCCAAIFVTFNANAKQMGQVGSNSELSAVLLSQRLLVIINVRDRKIRATF